MQTNYINVPTQYIKVNGLRIAYRRLGLEGTTPIIYLNHLAANLDNCDPIIMDALAKHFEVVSLDYPGIGASEGHSALSIEEMAQEVLDFIRAMGYRKVHLLGLSLGGFVAQAILSIAPELVESVILAGTGPAGDNLIARIPRITLYDMLRGAITRNDPRYYLFFPVTAEARHKAKAFLSRTQLRRDRDKPTQVKALLRQFKAIVAWAKASPQDLSQIKHRVWVVNGDYDRMVPTAGSYEIARRLPNASLTIYEGAGHGAIFQEAEMFARQALAFYRANDTQITSHN